MLTHQQEKIIRSLHTKKGRHETGLCLVEGQKNIDEAGDAIEYTFTREDTPMFDKLVTTETPQDIAGVARIPQCTEDQLLKQSALVVLDGVQDPGNVGTIMRMCLGFDAALLLIESVDPTNPKVVRSSAGALFQVPWDSISRAEAETWLQGMQESGQRTVYRLEGNSSAQPLEQITRTDARIKEPKIIIAGSEGRGIQLHTSGTSLSITTNPKLESLNVSMAVGITLHHFHALSL